MEWLYQSLNALAGPAKAEVDAEQQQQLLPSGALNNHASPDDILVNNADLIDAAVSEAIESSSAIDGHRNGNARGGRARRHARGESALDSVSPDPPSVLNGGSAVPVDAAAYSSSSMSAVHREMDDVEIDEKVQADGSSLPPSAMASYPPASFDGLMVDSPMLAVDPSVASVPADHHHHHHPHQFEPSPSRQQLSELTLALRRMQTLFLSEKEVSRRYRQQVEQFVLGQHDAAEPATFGGDGMDLTQTSTPGWDGGYDHKDEKSGRHHRMETNERPAGESDGHGLKKSMMASTATNKRERRRQRKRRHRARLMKLRNMHEQRLAVLKTLDAMHKQLYRSEVSKMTLVNSTAFEMDRMRAIIRTLSYPQSSSASESTELSRKEELERTLSRFDDPPPKIEDILGRVMMIDSKGEKDDDSSAMLFQSAVFDSWKHINLESMINDNGLLSGSLDGLSSDEDSSSSSSSSSVLAASDMALASVDVTSGMIPAASVRASGVRSSASQSEYGMELNSTRSNAPEPPMKGRDSAPIVLATLAASSPMSNESMDLTDMMKNMSPRPMDGPFFVSDHQMDEDDLKSSSFSTAKDDGYAYGANETTNQSVGSRVLDALADGRVEHAQELLDHTGARESRTQSDRSDGGSSESIASLDSDLNEEIYQHLHNHGDDEDGSNQSNAIMIKPRPHSAVGSSALGLGPSDEHKVKQPSPTPLLSDDNDSVVNTPSPLPHRRSVLTGFGRSEMIYGSLNDGDEEATTPQPREEIMPLSSQKMRSAPKSPRDRTMSLDVPASKVSAAAAVLDGSSTDSSPRIPTADLTTPNFTPVMEGIHTPEMSERDKMALQKFSLAGESAALVTQVKKLGKSASEPGPMAASTSASLRTFAKETKTLERRLSLLEYFREGILVNLMLNDSWKKDETEAMIDLSEISLLMPILLCMISLLPFGMKRLQQRLMEKLLSKIESDLPLLQALTFVVNSYRDTHHITHLIEIGSDDKEATHSARTALATSAGIPALDSRYGDFLMHPSLQHMQATVEITESLLKLARERATVYKTGELAAMKQAGHPGLGGKSTSDARLDRMTTLSSEFASRGRAHTTGEMEEPSIQSKSGSRFGKFMRHKRSGTSDSAAGFSSSGGMTVPHTIGLAARDGHGGDYDDSDFEDPPSVAQGSKIAQPGDWYPDSPMSAGFPKRKTSISQLGMTSGSPRGMLDTPSSMNPATSASPSTLQPLELSVSMSGTSVSSDGKMAAMKKAANEKALLDAFQWDYHITYDGTNPLEFYKLPLLVSCEGGSVSVPIESHSGFYCPLTRKPGIVELRIVKIFQSNAQPLLIHAFQRESSAAKKMRGFDTQGEFVASFSQLSLGNVTMTSIPTTKSMLDVTDGMDSEDDREEDEMEDGLTPASKGTMAVSSSSVSTMKPVAPSGQTVKIGGVIKGDNSDTSSNEESDSEERKLHENNGLLEDDDDHDDDDDDYFSHARVCSDPCSVFILKFGDDLRRDAAVLQMFRFVNLLWHESHLYYNSKPIQALTYQTIPISHNYGLIELIPNCITLKGLCDDKKLHKSMFGPTSEALYQLIATCAGSYMAAYLMGIRDRHYDNVLIVTGKDDDGEERDSSQSSYEFGTVFHIDFGYLLGDKVAGLDTAKFAITSDLAKLMGKRYSEFVEISCQAFMVLRDHSEELLEYARVVFAYLYPFEMIEHFLSEQLLLNEKPSKARDIIRKRLINAPKKIKTKMKNLVHSMAALKSGSGRSKKDKDSAHLSAADRGPSPSPSPSPFSAGQSGSTLAPSASPRDGHSKKKSKGFWKWGKA